MAIQAIQSHLKSCFGVSGKATQE